MTTYQKQCILAYFNCYSGALDGKWGPLSRAAAVRLQRCLGLEPDGIFGPATEAAARAAIARGCDILPEGEKPRYFSREDFRCKCAGRYCDGFPAEPDPGLLEIAQEAAAHFGREIDPRRDLISGLRCRTHNKNEGGVENSRHITGKAMDLRIPGVSAGELLEFLKTRPIRYAYAINDTNVHFDVV